MGAVASILFAAALGYLAVLAGSSGAWALMRQGLGGEAVGAFVVMCLIGIPYLLLLAANAVFSDGRYRLFQFSSALGAGLGFFGGAIWVLWLRGDPTPIASWRPPLLLLAAGATFGVFDFARHEGLLRIPGSGASRGFGAKAWLKVGVTTAVLLSMAAGVVALAMQISAP
jgi:hypothetical protein